MNILIIGLGSIGQRHLRNLKKLSKTYTFFAIRKKFKTSLLTNENIPTNKDIKKKYTITYLKKLNDIKEKKIKIDAAFICTPTKFHIDEAYWLIKNNINLFVEKPLGLSLKNINKLKRIIKSKPKVLNMMGYQFKFNPIILKMKKLIEKNIVGELYNIFIHNGQNLKEYHPYEDYKVSYAAKKELGGGIVLTQIHEIDYFLFLFEKFKIKIENSITSKISDLKINVEDVMLSNLSLTSRKKNKALCTIYLNFFEKPKNRKILIIGKKGRIECDLNNNLIVIFKNKKQKKIKFRFKNNEIFVKEIKYFMNKVKKQETIDRRYNILNGIKSLELALRLKNYKKL